MAAGLDSNFRQDVWIRHFHGYGIGALFPPVSVKLENVFVCWISLLLCIRWREGGQAQSHEDFSGCHLGGGSGNSDKKGSDDDGDDDDGGTETVPADAVVLHDEFRHQARTHTWI